mgnify:CR=1 FL=1
MRKYEEIVKEGDLVTYINATPTYAETSKPVIKVTDAKGKPVEGAAVDYRVYNYSELFPVATLKTDKNGECSLTIGNGDWVICCKSTDFGGNIRNGKSKTTINLLLILSFYPIFNFNILYILEMFNIFRNQCHIVIHSCTSY